MSQLWSNYIGVKSWIIAKNQKGTNYEDLIEAIVMSANHLSSQVFAWLLLDFQKMGYEITTHSRDAHTPLNRIASHLYLLNYSIISLFLGVRAGKREMISTTPNSLRKHIKYLKWPCMKCSDAKLQCMQLEYMFKAGHHPKNHIHDWH